MSSTTQILYQLAAQVLGLLMETFKLNSISISLALTSLLMPLKLYYNATSKNAPSVASASYTSSPNENFLVSRGKRLFAYIQDSPAVKYSLIAGFQLFLIYIAKISLDTQVAADAIAWLSSLSSVQSVTEILNRGYVYVANLTNQPVLTTAYKTFSEYFYTAIGWVTSSSLFISLSNYLSGIVTISDFNISALFTNPRELAQSIAENKNPAFIFGATILTMTKDLVIIPGTAGLDTFDKVKDSFVSDLNSSGFMTGIFNKFSMRDTTSKFYIMDTQGMLNNESIPLYVKIIAATKALQQAVMNFFSELPSAIQNSPFTFGILAFAVSGFIIGFLSKKALDWYKKPSSISSASGMDIAPSSIDRSRRVNKADNDILNVLGSIVNVFNMLASLNNSILMKETTKTRIDSYIAPHSTLGFMRLFKNKLFLFRNKKMTQAQILSLATLMRKSIVSEVKKLQTSAVISIRDEFFTNSFNLLIDNFEELIDNLKLPAGRMQIMSMVEIPNK